MENQALKPNLPNSDLVKPPRRASLLEQAKEAGSSSGVYLMKDGDDHILYIGKAKSLRNRLLSYFQPASHEIPRIEMLVSRIDHFDVILTETEVEAFILEATLIKKHKPKFNIRLKDDKAYPYLKIQIRAPFPRIELTRRVIKDGSRYFGPFPSAWSARQVLNLLNETYQLRDCSDNTFHHRSRPCILFQMKKCLAPCVGNIEQQNYQVLMNDVVQILEGKTERLFEVLKSGMEDAACREAYEEAAFYRDQMKNLELITQTQGVFEAGSQRNRDVIGIARREVEAYGTVLQVRGGKLISVQHRFLQNLDPSFSDTEMISDFLAQFYLTSENQKGELPEEVLIPVQTEEKELLEQTLGFRVRLAESTLDQQLLNVARANAEHALEQNKPKEGGYGIQTLEEIQNKLQLQKLPHRIECYDISNIQGEDAVASRVVFIAGAPDKASYRRYKIKTVEGANDFAMMKEVLGRRFAHTEEELPDLVIVDGGKGQLAQAVAILEELSVQGVGAVGLAKARVESDFRSKEIQTSAERIFIPNRKNPVVLLPHTGVYKLLTYIRDEAHRFAIQYHRLLHSKRSLNGSAN